MKENLPIFSRQTLDGMAHFGPKLDNLIDVSDDRSILYQPTYLVV
jgi:hypothetical protein